MARSPPIRNRRVVRPARSQPAPLTRPPSAGREDYGRWPRPPRGASVQEGGEGPAETLLTGMAAGLAAGAAGMGLLWFQSTRAAAARPIPTAKPIVLTTPGNGLPGQAAQDAAHFNTIVGMAEKNADAATAAIVRGELDVGIQFLGAAHLRHGEALGFMVGAKVPNTAATLAALSAKVAAAESRLRGAVRRRS